MGQIESGDTIAAISTPPGTGGIAVVRISGPSAVEIVSRGWQGADLRQTESHTVHLGHLLDTDGEIIDQCVATIFRAPRSYTGEETIELALHGSPWIQRRALESLIGFGARAATAGEFTRRAFLNGRLDLAQAEGVADLIASSSRAAHRLALQQASGGFSKRIDGLRAQLVEFAALLELELDFSEEDVEFADRSRLLKLARESHSATSSLAATFESGRAFKAGVPVVIAGLPNAGKSTLLNALLREEKAIVTPIAGTTRDILEDTAEIGGVLFRFIDTAGLHDSEDEVECIGIDRALERISKARILLWMIDTTADPVPQLEQLRSLLPTLSTSTHLLLLLNKSDHPESFSAASDLTESKSKSSTSNHPEQESKFPDMDIDRQHTLLQISAHTGMGIADLERELVKCATSDHNPDNELIVTNARHAEALRRASEALERAIANLEAGVSSDLTAMDIREATFHLSELTGALTTDTLLSHIFSHFCIGK